MKKILVLILVFVYSYNAYSWTCTLYGAANTMGPVVNVTAQAGTMAGCTAIEGATLNATFSERMTEWCTTNPFACVMAGLGAAQTVLAIVDYFKSKDVKDKSQCQGAFCNGDPTASNPNNPNNPNRPVNPYTYESPDPNDPMTPILRRAQETLGRMRAKGFEVNPDGSVKTPDGTMSAGQIASAASNMSAEDQAKLAAIQAEAAAEGKRFADAYGDGSPETGGGGGRKRGGGDGGGGSGFDMNAYLKSLNGGDGKRGVAGLSVRMGTDSVGVRESNIFEQVSAAYVKDPILNRREPIGP